MREKWQNTEILLRKHSLFYSAWFKRRPRYKPCFQKIILEVTQNVRRYCRKQMRKDLSLVSAILLVCAQFAASPFQ